MNKQDRRNTIVVAAVAGVLAGFILSMVMEVFNVGKMTAVPGWLQGVSGIVAVVVSVYAVYLVSKTLQATQDALAVTRKMADDQSKMIKDQREIGFAQTRAWVMMKSHKITDVGDHILFEITCSNYGNTPAKHVALEGRVVVKDTNEQSKWVEINKRNYMPLYRSAVAPKEDISYYEMHGQVPFIGPATYIELRIVYQTIFEDEYNYETVTLRASRKGGELFLMYC